MSKFNDRVLLVCAYGLSVLFGGSSVIAHWGTWQAWLAGFCAIGACATFTYAHMSQDEQS